MRWAGHGAVIFLLTLLTQVGGVIYAAALWGRRFAPFAATRLGFAGWAFLIYALAWFPVGWIAVLGGREALPCLPRGDLSASAFSCAFHRHYASPDLVAIASALARDIDQRFPGTSTRALDGSFPFFDGFPLPPHLSHDDGEKLDLAFYYERNGEYRRGALGSPLGYWKFEWPRRGEPQPCGEDAAGLRWDMAWFAPFTRGGLALEEERTRFALNWLAREGAQRGVRKVFVEPHLAQRLGVRGAVIRFQGCRAARHDDHIHIQL